MNKLYNNEMVVVKGLSDFFENIGFKLSRPQAKIVPHIITSIINAENVTTLDISKCYIDDSFLSNQSSIEKKLWRFFNNNKFNGIEFFNSSVRYIINNNIGCMRHNKLVVVLDHMYMKNNFVTLMFTLKVGKQSIPIWFKCDKTKSNRHYEIDELTKKCLFSEKVIFNAINEVIKLLSPLNAKITFLADIWFCNLKLMKFIHDKGNYFCIRAKVNSNIRVYIYDKKEKHKIYKKFTDFPVRKHTSLYYENIELGDFHFKCNLSIARGKLSDDPWFILSNIEPNLALREYGHRFGAIEMFFKSQKTNGFNLEKTKTRNLHAYENLYSLVCFAGLWLTIIGIDYTKNYTHVKKNLNIRFVKYDKNKKPIRILSLFNLGLTIFKMCYNSHINFKIKTNMQLYL